MTAADALARLVALPPEDAPDTAGRLLIRAGLGPEHINTAYEAIVLRAQASGTTHACPTCGRWRYCVPSCPGAP